MIKKILFILLLFSLLLPSNLFAQKKKTKKRRLIQFSGVVLDRDSLQPLPFVNIIVKQTYRGTISDYYGYFSFVAQPNDTIQFSYTGFETSYFVIPDSLNSDRYSIIQTLTSDTVYLKQATVHPWPTKEQFKEAFLNFPIPDDALARAKNNLSQEAMANKGNYYNQIADPNLNFHSTMNTYQTRLYQAGQMPTISLLNPLAWAKFIRAWRNGELKIKR